MRDNHSNGIQSEQQPTTTVGLVQINRALNLPRQRFQGRRVAGGSARYRVLPPSELVQWQLFPYSVGLLQAYVQKYAANPGAYRFLTAIHEPLAVDNAVNRLRGAGIVGFSVYVWNIELSLAIAKRLKDVSPSTVVVFGGPQVPDKAEAFLRRCRAVDVACHGQGEPTFLAILGRTPSRDWSGIAGVSYLDANDILVYQPPGPRLADLSVIPSPYLEGVFNPLMTQNPKDKWIMMWETNRGCPFACTFCDWGSATTSKVYQFDRERLRAELEWFARSGGEMVFCCDANFGILPRDVEIAADAVETKRKYGFPRTFAVQNTKNATERAYTVQKMLAEAGMNAGVTISLQSTDRRTLIAVKRDNISLASFQELQRRYTRDRIATYSDVILALPGETFETFVNGISEIIENGQHNRIHFYNCSLLPNAEMNDPAYRARFGIESVPQRMIDMHGPLDMLNEETAEYLQVVVATAAMPAADWVRAKAYWWMTDLVYFDRLLQIPFMVARGLWRLSTRDLIDAMVSADCERFPVIGGVHQWFLEQARLVQQGGLEYVPSRKGLGICWPADQYALIRLATSRKTDEFYDEAGRMLAGLLAARVPDADAMPLLEAVNLNRALLRLPFEVDDLELDLGHDIWAMYCSALGGESLSLQSGVFRHRVERNKPLWLDWEEWFEYLVFCQNQKASYLYRVRSYSLEAVT
jgi:radical SAM superfamily enzyme YgiQ (UPF0313 family)